MGETESPSELNLRRMLSMVLNPILSKINTEKPNQTEKPNTTENDDSSAKRETKIPLTPDKRSKTTDVLTRLLNLEDPNVEVKIGACSFNVNIEVLETYAEYFKERSESKIIELPEEHVTQCAFAVIYEWMLCDKPSLPRKGIVELFKAALYLEMPQFLAQFWQCVSHPLIVEDNAFLLYLEAMAYETPQLRQVMLGRISRYFLCIVASEEFLHLPIADICTLLRSDAIAVNAELEVFFACVRYFKFDWESRSPYLLHVMSAVRLDFLPTEFVLELLNPESRMDEPEVLRMMSHVELQDRLRDLMHYHCLAAFPGPNLVPIRKSNQRTWIFDSYCDHHDKNPLRSSLPHYVPYSYFCDYLKFLCETGPKHWENFEEILVANKSDSNEDTMTWEILE